MADDLFIDLLGAARAPFHRTFLRLDCSGGGAHVVVDPLDRSGCDDTCDHGVGEASAQDRDGEDSYSRDVSSG